MLNLSFKGRSMQSDHHIEVSYVRITYPFPEDVYGLYLKKLPEELKAKNQRFVRWEDRHAHLMGKILLLANSIKLGTGGNVLDDLKYNAYGKPLLDYLTFNISHSGEFVVCACTTSNIRLGIDIERKKPAPFSDFADTMNDEQWEEINRDPNRALDLFYRNWTIKESVIKAIGQGLSFPLKDITILNNTAWVKGSVVPWHIKEFFLDTGYAAAIVTDANDAARSITLKEFKFDSMLDLR